jgi:hypothetical protein
MQLTLDGGSQNVDFGLKTLGDLLASVETGSGPDRRVVTEVRFDGVVEPSFRQAESLGRTLSDGAAIAIETSTIRDLLESSTEVAIEQIPALVSVARATGRAFRRHDVQEGQASLSTLLGGLKTLIALTSILCGAKAAVAGHPEPNALGAPLIAMQQSLQSLTDCEMSQDWIGMADVLEFDIAAALPRWQELL